MILTQAAARGWRTVRRYAVPAQMIRHATERRLAGDWQGACAAADVAVEVELSALADRYGTQVAATVEEDLRHLAPDLLRWHLPRRPGTGQTALSPRRLSVLARYGEDGPILCVGSPRTGYGRQQLRLFTAEEPLRTERAPAAYRGDWDHEPCVWYQDVDPTVPRHRWDVRTADELLTWYDLDHVPGFDRAGRCASSPVTETELIHDLHDTARFAEAWDRAGVDIPEQHLRINPRMALGFWYRLPGIVQAVRRLGAESGSECVEAGYRGRPYLMFERVGAERMAVTFRSSYYHLRHPYLPLERLGVPLDALLLHLGYLVPDNLHHLVHAAFFPEAPAPPAGPPPPVLPEPVRVRCGGTWHEVRMRDGRVRAPHSAEDQQREAALAAFGGAVDGCFAVTRRWWAGPGRLPRLLKAQRRDLMLRALHGDTDGVTALLDGGVDPHVRDHRGRTLLHFMAHLPDPRLLPRLLAAGLDVDARDLSGLTPLAVAVHGMGDVVLIRALVEAGADVDVTFETGEPVVSWMEKARPADFAALAPLLRPDPAELPPERIRTAQE